jgi:pimeloyl-ACP methyl ester carboxylesterase
MNDEGFERTTVSEGKVDVYTLPEGNNGHVLIIPGWGEPAEVARELAEQFSKHGSIVSIVDYTDLNSLNKNSNCPVDSTFPITERARACAVVEFINSINDRVLVVAHSQGAVAGMLAAILTREKIRGVALVAPAGIVNLSMTELAADFLKSFFTQLAYVMHTENTRGKKYFSAVGKYIGWNPIQLARDAFGLSKSNIVPLLHKANIFGMDIHILGSTEDRVFPLPKIRERVQNICSVHALKGSHDELFFDPKESALQILSLFADDPTGKR